METALILEFALTLIDLAGKLYETLSRKGELTSEQADAFRKKLDAQKERFAKIEPFTKPEAPAVNGTPQNPDA